MAEFADRGPPTIVADGADVTRLYQGGMEKTDKEGPDPHDLNLVLGDGENLLVHAAALDDSAWTKLNATIDPDATTDSDGGTTADRITEDTATGNHKAEQSVTIAAGATIHCRWHVKRPATDPRDRVRCRVADGAGNGFFVDVDLTDGSIVAENVFGTGASLDRSYVSKLADGWFEVVARAALPSAATTAVQQLLLHDGSSVSYTGDGVSGVFVWAQSLNTGDYLSELVITGATAWTRPQKNHEITVDVAWELNGSPVQTDRIFGGHITGMTGVEHEPTGHYFWRVRARGYQWKANRDYKTVSIARGTANTVMTTFVTGSWGDQLALDGFTASGVESTANQVGPYDFERARSGSIMGGISRDGGQLTYIDHSKDVQMFAPDARTSSFSFDRQSDPDYEELEWNEDGESFANKIIVIGEGGRERIVKDQPSIDDVGEHEVVVRAPGVRNNSTFDTIGQLALDAHLQTVKSAKFATENKPIWPGENIAVADSAIGIDHTIRATTITWQHRDGDTWRLEVQCTTERDLGRIDALIEQAQMTVRMIEEEEPEFREEHHTPQYTAISSPDRPIPQAPSGDLNLQVRYNQGKGKWRMMVDNQVNGQISIFFAISFLLPESRTVTIDAGGLGVNTRDNNTQVPQVVSDGAWNVGSGDRPSVVLDLGGALANGGAAVLEVWGLSGTDAIRRLAFGTTTLATNLYATSRQAIPLDLEPYFAGRPADQVSDDSEIGKIGPPRVRDRQRYSGVLERPGGGVSAMEVRTGDGKQIVISADGKADQLGYGDGTRVEDLKPAEAGAELTTGASLSVLADRIGANIERSAGGPTLDRAFAKSAPADPDDMDAVPDGAGRAATDTTYLSSNRPFKLRRVVGAEDADADDLSKAAEVEGHLGGVNDPDIYNSGLGTRLLDRVNEELEVVHFLNNGWVGNPDGSEEPPNAVRAGGVRGLEAVTSGLVVTAKLTEAQTAAKEGSSVWGVQWNGDGSNLTASSGTGESGDGSGDSGGGDPQI